MQVKNKPDVRNHVHNKKVKLDRMFIITPRFDLMTSHPNLVGWEGVGRVGWVAIN